MGFTLPSLWRSFSSWSVLSDRQLNTTKKKNLSFSYWLWVPVWLSWASLVAQMVKNLPVMWETQVSSLGWKDPLEKGIATHFSILAWRIP